MPDLPTGPGPRRPRGSGSASRPDDVRPEARPLSPVEVPVAQANEQISEQTHPEEEE